MRIAILTLLAGTGFLGLAVSAQAGPVAPVPAAPTASNVIQVAGGCGLGFHRTRRGYCVPNRHAYYRPYPVWRPYWPGYSYYPGYYGDGYEPWNRPSPTDRVANQLNRQERYYGY